MAHLKLFGYPVEPMSKTTFYFSIAVLVIVDIIQSRYQKKLAAQRKERPMWREGVTGTTRPVRAALPCERS